MRKATRFLLLSLVIFSSKFVSAQGEFLIQLDTSNGSFTQIGSAISGINWVYPYIRGYDQNHGTYIFQGGMSLVDHLFSIDVTNGFTLHDPYFTPSGTGARELKYDNAIDSLYGLYWDAAVSQFFFASVDPVTGSCIHITSDPISGLNGTSQGGTAYDDDHHRYFCLSGSQLFSIDALSGNLIASPNLVLGANEQLLYFCYNTSLDTINGIIKNSNTQTFSLVTVDPMSGTYANIGPSTSIALGGGTCTIDESVQRFYLTYTTSTSTTHLMSLDISTGLISSDDQIALDAGDNIQSIAYDNNRNKLFGIQWDADGVQESILQTDGIPFQLFPVPSDGVLYISSPDTIGDINVYSSLGEVVWSGTCNERHQKLDLRVLAAGIYAIEIQGKFRKIILD